MVAIGFLQHARRRVFHLNRYPNCRVLAFEPNPPSYALAQKNLAPYGPREVMKLDVEHAEQEIILENSDEWLARTLW